LITLRLPASRIREVNRVLEDIVWGDHTAPRSSSIISYDYKAAGLGEHEKATK
jgi:hypothetical protein